MRRLLSGLALLLVAVGRLSATDASPSDEPFVLSLIVDRTPAEVRVRRETLTRFWPTYKGPIVAQFYKGGFGREGEARDWDWEGDELSFVIRESGVLLLFRGPESIPLRFHSLPVGGVVTRHEGLERFVWTGSAEFGAVASADPAVYDHAQLPRWFAAKLAPQKSVKSHLERPLPALRADAPMPKLRLRAVATHTGPISVEANWGDRSLGTISRDTAVGGTTFEWTVPTTAWAAVGQDATITLTDRTVAIARPADPNDTSDDVGVLWLSSLAIDAATAPHEGRFVELEPGVFQALVAVSDDGLVPYDRSAASVGPVDEAIVATPPLVEGARRLAAHRTAHGINAAVVSTEALAPRGDAAGLSSAISEIVAIRKPRFLLLVGDADHDLGTKDTIPTFYARTLYNGATATDAPYGEAKDGGPGAIVGRLPFSNPKTLDAYVDRVIRAETKPPTDDTRRTLRFIASEGRFGPEVDSKIEALFGQAISAIPLAYDVDVTFARAKSDYGWPASEFNQHVIDEVNRGSLFFTYVGHGWWSGFDDLRVEGKRYPILKSEHVDQVEIRGTPPAMFVIACTTALFDDPKIRSVGERLMDRWNGPLAYFGATRVCHPAWNSIVGWELAMGMKEPKATLGEIVAAAVSSAHAAPTTTMRRAIEFAARTMLPNPKVTLERLKDEGAAMYVLLGDPAVRIPFPREDLVVEGKRGEKDCEVTVSGPMPDGTEVVASLEVARTTNLPLERDDTWSPEEAMRRRHARSNDKSLARATATAKGGKATFSFAAPADRAAEPLFVKAQAVFGADVHQGALEVRAP